MKALVTGIKSYVQRTRTSWGDHHARPFDSFSPVRTKKEFLAATTYNGNTGNFLIGEGATFAVGFNSAHYCDFSYLYSKRNDPDYIQKLKSEFSCVVFVTANLLRSDYNAQYEADLFKALGLPLVVIGIGCQRTGDLNESLPAGTREFIDYLSQTESHVFTRGKPTTAFLQHQGLKNVWATGCPSMYFRHLNVIEAMKRLKGFEFTPSSSVVTSGYLGHDRQTVDDIHSVKTEHGRTSYVLQDEYMFHKFEINGEDQDHIYNDMTGQIVGSVRYAGMNELDYLDNRVFFNNDQWRGFISAHDLCVGRRFHGVVSGLQAAVPGLMIAIDDRMSEMIEQFGLPSIHPSEWASAPDKKALIEQKAKEFDFSRFEEQFLEKYHTFKRRMSDLGLGH